ncbi:MAG: cyclic nucleotide-binding domain-containing protein [Thermodesulfobacteriota bacterium]
METIKLFQESEDFTTYNAGNIIFNSGSVAIEMFVIKKGEVDILYNDRVLETLKEGDIFGEMSLIDDKPRSATAVAKVDCQIVPGDKERFSFLIQQSSFGSDFAIHVMKIMADRIRKINYLASK